MSNCTFIYFKPSGKFYSSARGMAPTITQFISTTPTRELVIICNDSLDFTAPGLSTNGSNFIIIIVPDEEIDHTVYLSYPVLCPI